MGDLQKVKRYSLRQRDSEPEDRRYGVISILLLLVATMFGVMGWQYRKQIDVKTTRVVGAKMSQDAEILRLAAVDTSQALYSIDPKLVSDRVLRHPWIRDARVQRLPTGVLKISVSERVPVVTVVSSNGKPSHYIDADCYQMPFTGDHTFDVPLISGRVPAFHPVKQIDNKSICALAKTLTRYRGVTDRFASEFVVDRRGEVTMYTKPVNGYGSMPVRLGSSNYSERFIKLDAFWDQVILDPSRKVIKKIDLRFDSQIVTE
jgi:cell division protein FtsQ